jgi:hypothetical protein
LIDDGPDFELLAASLRADARDVDAFVEALGAKLEGALPARTRVVRRSARLLSKQKRVKSITVDLGEDRFVLERTAGMVETRHAHTVRGIVLKSETVGLDDWIGALVRAIAQAADTSEHGRLALAQLLG